MRPQFVIANLVLLVTALSSCSSQHLEVEKFLVPYEIRYSSQCAVQGQSPPPPTTVTVAPQSTALNAMEAAVAGFDPTYRFSATYFGAGLGYFIDKIGNVGSNTVPNCFWIFYATATTVTGEEVSYTPNFGVSNFLIPSNDAGILWNYEYYDPSGSHSLNNTNSTPPDVDPPMFVNDTDQGPGSFLINYIVYANTTECVVDQASFPPPVTVSIPRGGFAINVMENARDINRAFAFSATYFGVTFGYFIDTIGETSGNDNCAWTFLYQPPSKEAYAPAVGVSNFVLPVNGGTVVMAFRAFETSTPPPATSMPTEDQAVGEEEGTTASTSGTGYVQPTIVTLAAVIYTMILALLY